MRDHYDFSKATKNPYAKHLKDGYTIVIERKDYDEIIEIKKSKREKVVKSEVLANNEMAM